MSDKAPAASRPGNRFVIAAVLVAVTMSVAVAALVVVSGSVGTGQRAALATRHVPPALPNGPPVLRHAVLWIADNVPTSAPVLADRRVAGALRARSFADLLPVTFGPADGTPAYVVETRAIRAAAAHRAAVRTALAASAPVARFGGAGGIVVRQHVDVGAARLARLQAADQRARQALEGGLLRDAALTVSATARRILSAGVLDLRAATALSLLTRRGPVRLVAVPVVRPERAAGLPAGVIEIRVRGSVATAALQQLSLPYHPTSVRQLGGGLQRWTWSIRAQPLAPR